MPACRPGPILVATPTVGASAPVAMAMAMAVIGSMIMRMKMDVRRIVFAVHGAPQ
jgi:hypothetical protein